MAEAAPITWKVEVAFGSSASEYDATAVWSDVSADIRSITTSNGRQYELNQFDAGTATVVLGNRSGQYDPQNTSSPYWDSVNGVTTVLPMKKIRITGTSTDGNYEFFHGYVTAYQQDYTYTKDATTTLTCVDASILLNIAELSFSPYASAVTTDSPAHYYRLGEAVGSTSVSDQIAQQTLKVNGLGVLGATGLVAFDADTAYTQPAGTAVATNFLFNGSSAVAVQGTPNQSLQFPNGSVGTRVTSPDSTAFTGLSGFDVRVKLSRPYWYGFSAASEDLIGKAAGSGHQSFKMGLIGNQMYFGMSTNGSIMPTLLTVGATALNYAPGSTNWIGATASSSGSTWTWKFWTFGGATAPADITTWTQIGGSAAVTLSGSTMFDSDALIAVGAAGESSGGIGQYSGQPLNANVYEAVIRSSVNGTIIAHPDFTDIAQYSVGNTSGHTGTDSTGKVWTLKNNVTITGGATPFSIEAFFKWDTTQTVANGNWVIAGQGDGNNGWVLLVTQNNHLNLQIISGGVTVASASVTTPSVTDGLVHHVVGTYDSLGVPRVYLDGVLQATGSALSVTMIGNGFGIGLASQLPGFGFTSWSGTIDEVALYAYALSATQIANHALQGETPGLGDTPETRIEKALALVGWDPNRVDIDPGTVLLQAGGYSGTVLSYIQRIAQSDQGIGILWISADGYVKFRQATDQWDGGVLMAVTASNFTGITTQYDDTNIRNVVTVGRTGGVPQLSVDPQSANDYSVHSYSALDLEMDTDATASNAASLIVSLYSKPFQRITSITFNAFAMNFATSNLAEMAIGMNIGNIIQVSYTPVGGHAITGYYQVEGVSHNVAPGTGAWTMTWKLAPSVFDATMTPIVPKPVTWVYANNRYGTWNGMSSSNWNTI